MKDDRRLAGTGQRCEQFAWGTKRSLGSSAPLMSRMYSSSLSDPNANTALMGCCFHTDEHGCMDATSHRNAVWRDHREFHAMFIHLGQLRWGGNGEGKRAWGLPIALGPGQLFALLSHLWFLVEGSYRGSDLIVGRKREGGGMVLL